MAEFEDLRLELQKLKKKKLSTDLLGKVPHPPFAKQQVFHIMTTIFLQDYYVRRRVPQAQTILCAHSLAELLNLMLCGFARPKQDLCLEMGGLLQERSWLWDVLTKSTYSMSLSRCPSGRKYWSKAQDKVPTDGCQHARNPARGQHFDTRAPPFFAQSKTKHSSFFNIKPHAFH